MLRLAAILLIGAVAIGTLMPSADRASGDPASGDPESADRAQGYVEAYPIAVAALASEPRSQTISDGPDVRLRREADGHFYADARVNGTTIRFLVDTGASGVALSERDASRAGVDFASSRYQVIGSGASGEVRGEFVRLDSVELGEQRQSDASAVVLDTSDHSLLGQSFLRRFASVTIEGDSMILR